MPSPDQTAARTGLARFLLLYIALYAGFGAQSPFLPLLLARRGLAPAAIGLILATSTAIRLIAGPVAGRAADRLSARRVVLAICALGAALTGTTYLAAHSLWPLFCVALLQAATLAPLVPLSDALAVGSTAPRPQRRSFEYGWVRGAGSAAFILGVTVAGELVGRRGPGVIVWLNSALLLLATLAALRVPDLHRAGAAHARPAPIRPGIATLFRLRLFRRLMLVAALIQGSHAMHDSFAVLRWQAGGITSAEAGLLWSESVAAEVLVFLFLGRPILDRLGPAGASVLAAVAGIVRWGVEAETARLGAIACVQPLHGLTFALQHLACMRLIAATVPPELAATAQAVYGTLCVGAMTALLTLASGPLYGDFGAAGFWVMAALCAIALPLARGLRAPVPEAG
jgi:MFS transporter, PPP family, 3-phenylpropionic acid transporter